MAKKKFTMKGYYDEVAEISQQVRGFFEKNKINTKVCDEIEICLTEALNNVIKHSYKGETDKPIEVLVNKKKKILEIEIIDTGEARKSFDKPTLDFDPEDIESLPEGGMGLFIIEEIMNETHYRVVEDRNIYTMRKFVK